MSASVNVEKKEIHLPNITSNKEKMLEYGNKAT